MKMIRVLKFKVLLGILVIPVLAGFLFSCDDGGAGGSEGSTGITFTGPTDYVARYTFDSSDFSDSTGDHPFTTNTGAYDTENAKIGTGCAYYDGSTYSATASNISMSGGSYTLAFWAKIDETTLSSISYLYSYMALVSIDDFYPCMNKNSYMKMSVPYSSSTSSFETQECASAVSDVGTWHHYVFTVKDNAAETASIAGFYCDGVLLDDSEKFGSGYIVEDSSSACLKVGYPYSTSWSFFTGYIDDVIFYDRALSESEVAALYSSF